MNVVVAGGTGLVGRALVASLLADGATVTVLSRAAKAPAAADVPALPWRPGSDDPGGVWPQAVAEADAVVNLAGASLAGRRWNPAYKKEIVNSRLRSTNALVGALAVAHRPGATLVSASAVGYYGPCDDEPVTEEHPAGHDFLAGVCTAWEDAAVEATGLGVRVVRLRSGAVLARDGGALPRLVLPFRLLAGGPLGSGRQWMPWVHLEDAVALIRFAIDRADVAGPVNVTAPEPVQNREFAQTLGRVLARPALLPVPAVVLRLALGETADALLLSGQRAVPTAALASGYAFRHPSLAGALTSLLA